MDLAFYGVGYPNDESNKLYNIEVERQTEYEDLEDDDVVVITFDPLKHEVRFHSEIFDYY